MAIPGIVLGLSYVIFFHGSALYGTIFIVVLADSIHFFASPYLMMYNTLGKIDPELEAVGQCLGVGRLRIIRDVILPKVRGTVYEMFGYFFVNSMMTISAVSFLVPPSPKPVALMINQFESQLLMESAAFVSLLILAVNIALKVAVSGAKRVRFPLRAKARTCGAGDRRVRGCRCRTGKRPWDRAYRSVPRPSCPFCPGRRGWRTGGGRIISRKMRVCAFR